MDVFLYARACSFANICANIECLGIVNAAENCHTARGQFHHFSAGLGVEIFQSSLMIQWDNHQMSTRIRIAVENYVRVFTAKRDEILSAVYLFLRIAKHAPIFS